ncbi:unknown [Clostridium sp. CAG:306]|nr:unknown [Clostridium sp. CAG:306]
MKQYKIYNFIEITKKEFQQYQSESITTAQAIEIQNNLFGVVDLIIQWSLERIKQEGA